MFSSKTKNCAPLVLCLAAVRAYALFSFLTLRSWPLTIQCVFYIALAIATAVGLRAERPWAVYAAAAIALLALPSLLFPLSFLILWWVLPDEVREKTTTFVRAEVEACRKKS